ncbi:MAP3K7IP2 [Lepeophtheirus salmonis]|uniref:MAP3K7IP2 n=1 Tax=Lepeophtheirus salmonis TaxID=72036 RepID=A0A7R8HDL9_LEPSM|nr:MAP3K7IP2 [Lepeophtheirus salmonis]CAF3013516.1 MAP3K7IP2 [Lepeophtheirus salmonis]
MTSDNSNVIFYMKLMHELKAEYPNVPDEAVKDTIIKYCGDKELCIRELSAQSLFLSRSKRAMKEGKIFNAKSNYRSNKLQNVIALVEKILIRRIVGFSHLPIWSGGGKCSLCDGNGGSGEESHSILNMKKKAPDKNANFITLNANIQPFAPFIIRHDSEGAVPGALTLLNSLNHLHHDSSGHSSMGSSLGANSDKMEMNVDGGKVHYATSTINSEEGVESHLEVSLGKTESFITTTHTDLTNNLSNSSSSIFHLQYEDGGKVLNITSNFNNSPDPKRRKPIRGNGPSFQTSRPASLNLNSLFAHGVVARPSSAYCTQLNNPTIVSPRYNSLPNLNMNGLNHLTCYYPEEFQSNPADEEKRLAYTRALLTHQMEQCLKLDQELRSERSKLNNIREEIALIEERRNKKRLLKLNAQLKRNEGIEKDIKSLRYSCDTLAAKVTKITKGKVPLGETNVEFYGFLSPKLSDNKKPSLQIKDAKEPLNNLSKLITSLDQDKGNNNNNNNSPINDSESSSNNIIAQWACTECTFLNHPALNHCEECEMPRFSIGCSNQENVQPLSFMGKNSL